jgi:hypothetical protein
VIVLSTAIATHCLATEALADTIIAASNNATIQPGGPRAGANGKNFFNMEGSSNGTFADFGVVDFQTPTGITFGTGQQLSLALTQDNAAFTANGSLAFYVSTDTTTGIEPGTSPLAFQATSLPTGLGTQLDTKYLLGTGTFTEVANGHIDVFTFTPTGAALSYLTTQIDSAGKIRLIVAPDDANVAATYAGFSNTDTAGPVLRISSPVNVPEPSTILLEVGPMIAIVCARRRIRNFVEGKV